MKKVKDSGKGLKEIDQFNLLLFFMWADCKHKKKYKAFSAALEKASDILNGD